MSLNSLLRHVGIHVPRGVTVDGRIVLGAPTIGSGVTALEPHTSHGGPDPESRAGPGERQQARNDQPWWDLDPARREADKSTVLTAFPSFMLDDSDGGYTWKGIIDTAHGRYRIDVIGNPVVGMPFIWPRHPRRLGRQESGRWRPPPHLYKSGRLCVAETSDWIPERHTTATAIAWAAHWLAAYTVWRTGSPWPTEGFQPRPA
jgi:hypothetical protein